MKRAIVWCCLLITVMSSAIAAPSRIQLALLLDTSGSMDGLLKQAKSQLWSIVSAMSTATKNGKKASLELALYEYGNSGIPVTSGYIRQICPFTTDLDLVSEKLFLLTTNGGEEYCPTAIVTGVNDLAWTKDATDMHLIVIAGNEEFHQGSVTPEEACKAASAKHISVTTIYCGSMQEGRGMGWDFTSNCKGGAFFAINSDGPVEHIVTPFDTSLARLNTELNSTYQGYGVQGRELKLRQDAQDANASGLGASVLAERSAVKANAMYKNTHWDLVDLYTEDAEAFKNLKPDDLPVEVRSKSTEEREEFVKGLQGRRTALQAEIQRLNQQRLTFVAQEEKTRASRPATVGSGIMNSMRALAEANQFSFAS